MRVVVAEPGKRAEVREIGSGLDAMQAVVGGWLEVVPTWAGHDLWLNEEGRLVGLEPNRLVRAPQSDAWWDIYGTLFVASSNDEGETVSLSETEAEAICAALNGSDFCQPLNGNKWETP